MKNAEAEFRRAEATQTELSDQVQSIRAQIREQTGRVEVTPDGMRQLIDKLQDEKEQLDLEEAGAQGRRKGLLDAINRVSEEARTRAASDEVVKELNEAVALRQAQLDRYNQIKTAVTQADLNQAAANLVAAKADLAAARQRATAGAADTLDQWNRELLKLSVDQQDRRARLDFLAARLEKLTPVLGELDQLERAKERLAQANKRLDQTQDYLQRLRMIYDLNRDEEELQRKLRYAPQQ